MGVYIKDMEMPTSCDDCPLGDSLHCQVLPSVPVLWAEYTNAIREKRLHNACPLVPVPPHGRLVDADALLSQDRQIYNGKITVGRRIYIYPEEVIDAPTIIPAEEE